jgi:hypothetical protein
LEVVHHSNATRSQQPLDIIHLGLVDLASEVRDGGAAYGGLIHGGILTRAAGRRRLNDPPYPGDQIG